MKTLLRLASAPGMAGLLLGLGATAPAHGAKTSRCGKPAPAWRR